jgi:hypothetical protein
LSAQRFSLVLILILVARLIGGIFDNENEDDDEEDTDFLALRIGQHILELRPFKIVTRI